ncbi:unnamed protein product [Oncorhynchus mykiss]|uniref:CRIB domain-containing protein n=1 Tax=Oncorhynchus mykiss TaxID=8022 RepID=A0A060VUL9_ONCMY|nr:unnamed protein product [Oncorhynchus mykiss]
MPAKAPIYLKSKNSKKGKKCRLRDILSPDMISPPLGDFRHTIHIGKGGERDAFGDMSFLQGRFELLPGKGEVFRPQYSIHNEFLRANSASDAQFPDTPSPVLKNAISLPSIGGCQALTLPHLSTAVFSMPAMDPLVCMVGRIPTSPLGSPDGADILETEKVSKSHHKKHNCENGYEKSSPSYYINGNSNGNGLSDCNGDWVDRDSGVDEGRLCDFDFEFSKDKSVSQYSISHITGSLLSLELDLGPSILDDVLNIMGDPKAKSRP